MFTCDQCLKPVGPAIAPIRVVTQSRLRVYENTNEEGEVVTSRGSEVVTEERLCHACAGVPLAKVDTTAPYKRFEEALAPTFRQSMASCLIETLINKSEYRTKRMQKGFLQGMSLLKGYEERGGGL